MIWSVAISAQARTKSRREKGIHQRCFQLWKLKCRGLVIILVIICFVYNFPAAELPNTCAVAHAGTNLGLTRDRALASRLWKLKCLNRQKQVCFAYQKACFQGKKKGQRRKIHIHQRGFQVFVGDPFAQYWCIDFGLPKTELAAGVAYACDRVRYSLFEVIIKLAQRFFWMKKLNKTWNI